MFHASPLCVDCRKTRVGRRSGQRTLREKVDTGNVTHKALDLVKGEDYYTILASLVSTVYASKFKFIWKPESQEFRMNDTSVVNAYGS